VDPNRLAGRAVLVADDDTDGIELLAEVLRLAGADVRLARTAPEALGLLDGTWSPDAMVLDIGLPKVDGYDLLRSIRAMPALSEVPAVAVSAYAFENDKRQATAAGFQMHLDKPYDVEALIDIVAKLTDGKRSPPRPR
jgi:CheY-like chemotaxis protein